jgi:hypothetical protein
MSVLARSLGGAGRPVFGRPAAVWLVALIATFAIGAPAAVAQGPEAVVTTADAPTTHPAAPAADPSDGPPPQVDSPAVKQPVAPPAVDTPPVEAPLVDPPQVDTPPTTAPPEPVPLPAETSPEETSPEEAAPPAPPESGQGPPSAAPSPEPESGQGPPSAAPSAEPEAGGSHFVAENVSITFQAVWQVQHGCKSHCHGTSQSQTSIQWSETTQSATAIAQGTGPSSSTAEARNRSLTVQFVWQQQIGCVAFCFETSQTQEAFQNAHTSQATLADAISALAENLAATFQSGEANAGSWDGGVSGPTLGEDGSVLLPDWLVALALNFSATIQTVYQYQEALCEEHCVGDAQVQEAFQRADTTQEAVAAPPTETEAPVEPPPAEEPPAEQPSTAAPAPATVAEAAAPATAAKEDPVAQPVRRRSVVRRTLYAQEVRRHETKSRSNSPAALGVSLLAAAAAPREPTIEHVSLALTARAVAAAGAERATRLPARTANLDPGRPTPDGPNAWLLIVLLAALVMLFLGVAHRLSSHLRPSA